MVGTFLNCLDGIAPGDGLIAFATTNNLNAIEPALRNRPNRFDVVLEIGPLDADRRHNFVISGRDLDARHALDGRHPPRGR